MSPHNSNTNRQRQGLDNKAIVSSCCGFFCMCVALPRYCGTFVCQGGGLQTWQDREWFFRRQEEERGTKRMKGRKTD